MSSSASSRPTAVSPATPSPKESYTTPNGTVCTLQNAGRILSTYLQAYGYPPQNFKTTVAYRVLPPAEPVKHKRLKSADPQQPPPLSQFDCTITLPEQCPIKSMKSPGEGHRSKEIAKRQASLAIVEQLVGMGEIDYNLFPTPKNSIKEAAARDDKHYQQMAKHAMRRTLSPTGSESRDKAKNQDKMQAFSESVRSKLPGKGPGNAMYPRIPHAAFWDSLEPFQRDNLYPTLVEIQLGEPYAARAGECRIICLLTTQPLPIKQEHVIDLKVVAAKPVLQRIDANARLKRGLKLKKLEREQLEAILTFNRALFRALINKSVDSNSSSAKYLVLPMRRGYKISGDKIRRRDIAWNEVDAAKGPLRTPLTYNDPTKLEEEIYDAVISLNVEFSSRYYAQQVRTDLSPLSPHPENPNDTIQEMATRRQEIPVDPSQPILIGEYAQSTLRGGFLSSLIDPDVANKPLVPQLVLKHFASASVLKTTSAIPALLRALDDLFVADQLSSQLAEDMSPPLVLLALTCPSVNNKVHSETYERLEMLGDALLKFLVAVYLINIKAADSWVDWDKFHVERQVMVSNRTLRSKVIGSGIAPYIRGAATKTKSWVPMGWWVASDPDPKKNPPTPKPNDDTQQTLGDKTLADVAEALVAAGFLSMDAKFDGALKIMHKLHMPLDGFTRWEQVVSNQSRKNAAVRSTGLPLTVLGYTFQRPRHGRVALSMSPASRSQFNAFRVLGDASISWFLAHGLYLQYPDEGPGSMTVMHHSRHGDSCLAAIGVVSGVAGRIADALPDLLAQIGQYQKSIWAAKEAADCATDAAGRWEFWAETPPCSPVSEVVYALLGAILVDSNYDIEALRQVYQAHFLPFFDLYCVGPGQLSPHPRTIWSEMIHKRGCSQWNLQKTYSPSGGVAKLTLHNQVIGTGQAETESIAVRRACDEAIERCKAESVIEKYCTCPNKKAK